jgi:tripartite-type tricarboxylate transporter receptor subunit TctC
VALLTVAPNLPLKLPRDFLPIGYIADNPMFVAVTPSLGVTTLAQLIALAKKEPGKVSIAVTGVGRLTHLTGDLLQQRADIKLLSVPYTGGPAPALGDVTTGRVSMIIEGYSGIVGAVNAGLVKLIAVASPERLPQFPDLPTVAETIPGFSATGWQVLVAPVGTPEPIIRKVSDDLRRVVTDPDFKARLAKIGSYSRAMSPAEALAFVEKEQQTWLPVLQKIAAATK